MSCAPDPREPAPWGRWTPGGDPDVGMMVCTAGHVDHGKTRLVKLLTGCETDRLREEKERGLTIELGFAPCRLGDDFSVGIVDVPGHERFVRNMVAGVSGIEMAILVVAADDGVMPQTVEHLQIMELLGVGSAVAAVTKTDLVGADRVDAAVREVRALLADGPFRSAPVCPVSAETIEGFEAFCAALAAQARNVVRRRSRGVFRMPVERTFSLAGHGLVLSGIPLAGSIGVGDRIEAVPGGRPGRVRGIQRFGRDAPSGGFGQCLALNVPEWSRHAPDRGCVVASPGYLQPVLQLHLDLRTVPDLAPPLRNAERIMFHAGTSEVSGKIYLLEGKELAAGGSAPATVVLDAPVGAARHDRFLVRRPSPARTVGGGVILDVAPDRRRQPRARALERLAAVSLFFGTDRSDSEAWPRKACEFFLREDAEADASLAAIAFASLLPGETARGAVAELVRDGTVLDLGRERFVHAGRYERIRDGVLAGIRDGRLRAGSLAVAREDLRGGRPGSAALWNRLFDELERGGLLRADAARVVLVERSDEVQRTQADLVEQVIRVFAETGFHAPRPDELPALLAADPGDVARVVEHLCLEGALFRLAKNVILDKDHLRAAQERVVDIIQCSGNLDSGEFKHAIRSSRKYALAVLDWLDARGVTLRHGNLRTLAPRYRERMI